MSRDKNLRIFIKVIVIISFSLTLTILSAQFIKDITGLKFYIKNTNEGPFELFPNQDNFKEMLQELPSFIKVPILFLDFNLFGQNNVIAIHKDKDIDTYMSTDFYGTYTHKIITGQKKKVLTSIRVNQLDDLLVSRSFDITEEGVDITDTKPKDASSYEFFIRPTLFSYLIVFIIYIAIFPGFLAIFNRLKTYIQ